MKTTITIPLGILVRVRDIGKYEESFRQADSMMIYACYFGACALLTCILAIVGGAAGIAAVAALGFLICAIIYYEQSRRRRSSLRLAEIARTGLGLESRLEPLASMNDPWHLPDPIELTWPPTIE